jgi:hypothetical protein
MHHLILSVYICRICLCSALRSFKSDLERTIVDNECNTYHWTLMHRYHKAADIINEVGSATLLLLLLLRCTCVDAVWWGHGGRLGVCQVKWLRVGLCCWCIAAGRGVSVACCTAM